MRITCNFVKPNILSISDFCTKPCRLEQKEDGFLFNVKHRFGIEVYCEDNGETKLIAILNGVYADITDPKSRADVMGAGYTDAIRSACSGYDVDNLGIIDEITISENVTLAELQLMWTKILCIVCQSLTFGFKDCRNPAIYFDLSEVDCKEIIASLIPRYEDGDVRREFVGDNDHVFIHKIPWKPVEQNPRNMIPDKQMMDGAWTD